MKRRLISLLLVFCLMIGNVSILGTRPVAAKSKTKKMTTYDVIVKGKTAYVSGAWCTDKIYKVNLKTKKVSAIKYKQKGANTCHMRIKKGYLYFEQIDSGLRSLCRVKLKNPKKTDILFHQGSGINVDYGKECYFRYAVGKKRVYIAYNDSNKEKTIKKSMKLSGRDKKTSKYNVKNTCKKSNKKGYKLIVDDSHFDDDNFAGYVVYYLGTPSGKIKLDKVSF